MTGVVHHVVERDGRLVVEMNVDTTRFSTFESFSLSMIADHRKVFVVVIIIAAAARKFVFFFLSIECLATGFIF